MLKKKFIEITVLKTLADGIARGVNENAIIYIKNVFILCKTK